MIRPIRVDHTKFLQVAIKTHSFNQEQFGEGHGPSVDFHVSWRIREALGPLTFMNKPKRLQDIEVNGVNDQKVNLTVVEIEVTAPHLLRYFTSGVLNHSSPCDLSAKLAHFNVCRSISRKD
jgi:hypothetical protein